VPITKKGFPNEKVLALAPLARSLSNQKGTLSLLREKRIAEARTITRCRYENLYWVVGLIEEGEAFARRMANDDTSHRKHRGQLIFEAGVTFDDEVEDRLRAWLRNANTRLAGAETLNPKKVASLGGDVGKSYIFYSQLSSDAAHRP
jgi:hypothetical protein